MAHEIKLQRGERREVIIPKYNIGIERAVFTTEILKMLRETHQDNIIPTMERMCTAIKQIGISQVVNGCNPNGESKVLAWCGDHIYTLTINHMESLLDRLYGQMDKTYESNDFNPKYIYKLNDEDSDTVKRIKSTN